MKTMNQDKVLFFEDVKKGYPKKDGGRHVVLDDIDLAVSPGEFLSLVGPSGCGKSTLLRLILGQERPDHGSVTIFGQEVGLPDSSRGIVFQKYSLFPHLTVLQNVALGIRLANRNPFKRFLQRTEHRKKALEMLAKVRLSGSEDKYPHELSGGMRQRVAIAQALATNPKILLMDEPFGALDPGTREEMQVFLLSLWEDLGMTVFFITHDLTEAVFLGSRTIVLSPFYNDDRTLADNRGSRIVLDIPTGEFAHATTAKHDPNFLAVIEEIREAGFDPAHLQDIRNFNLSHPDSFMTAPE